MCMKIPDAIMRGAGVLYEVVYSCGGCVVGAVRGTHGRDCACLCRVCGGSHESLPTSAASTAQQTDESFRFSFPLGNVCTESPHSAPLLCLQLGSLHLAKLISLSVGRDGFVVLSYIE